MGDEPRAFTPDWADLRRGTAVALLAMALVRALEFASSALTAGGGLPYAPGVHARVARLRTALSLVTTALLTGLLISRQLHLFRWAERAQRAKEDALRQSEERFSKAFSASPAAMSISTLEEGRYVDVNENYLRLMGKQREEVIGRTSLEVGFFHKPEERERLIRDVREGVSVRATPVALRRSSGEARDVLVSLEPVDLDATRCLLGVVEDVTERRRADEALKASERRYRLLFERNLAGVFRMSTEGRVLECNESLVHLLRYENQQALLALPAGGLYFTREDSEAEMRLLLEKKSLTNHEVRLRRRDGSPVWVVENATLGEDGDGLRAVVEGTVVDITARRRAEEETLRLAELKTNFLVVAAHEMRTPLTVLSGYHELLLAKGDELTQQQRRSVDVCHRTVKRMTSTFNDILAALQIGEGRLTLRRAPFDLRELTLEILEEVAPFVERRRQRTHVAVPDRLPPVVADRDRIHEAVWNLVENAIKFTPDEGEITVRLGVEPGWLRITVEDTGIGIEAQEIEDIWERFYAGADPQHHRSGTYEFKTRGSGLGLVIAKGCVEAHGGRIFATSAGTDRGAAFTILLRFDPSGARVATG